MSASPRKRTRTNIGGYVRFGPLLTYAVQQPQRYSITSSARARSGSGTFSYRPNVLTGATRSHRHDPLHQPPLLAPEAHIHVSVHRGGAGQILLGLLWLAGAAIELAQAYIAMGD